LNFLLSKKKKNPKTFANLNFFFLFAQFVFFYKTGSVTPLAAEGVSPSKLTRVSWGDFLAGGSS
jgi:hypothetical protein